MSMFEFARNIALLIFAAVGAWLAARTYSESAKQRRFDNTLKSIEYLRRNISDDQIKTVKSLFHANNPLAGHPDEFRFEDGSIEKVEHMFSEGGCGNGHVHNMIEVFNLICRSLNSGLIESDLIWYEYGQLMLTCYEWTLLGEQRNLVPQFRHGKVVHLPMESWPEFHRFMSLRKRTTNPMRYYFYAE